MNEQIYRIFLTITLPIAFIKINETVLLFLQLSGYRVKGAMRVLKLPEVYLFLVSSFIFFLVGVSGLTHSCYYFLYPLYSVFVITAAVLSGRREFRTSLVYTGRIKRIAAVSIVFEAAFIYFIDPFLIGALLPFFSVASMYALYPFEKLNNLKFIVRASKKLKNSNAITIAVVGSFGKTTVKNLIEGLISESYKTLSTPLSFNTPLGIAKTINNSKADFEVFVVEFGARRVGDIRYLTKYFPPDIAVLTGLTGQHLETFKSIENIVKGKLEVLHNNPKSCIYIVNADNEILAKAIAKENKNPDKPFVYCGFCGSDIKVKLLNLTDGRSEFSVNFRDLPDIEALTDKVVSEQVSMAAVCGSNAEAEGATTTELETSLLGRHNIVNISLAAAVAKTLKVNNKSLKERTARLKPVPHRLELIKGNGGLNIIDDSYNANPEGVKNALEVLMGFEGGKYVITCGIVEQGGKQRETNIELGKRIAEVADLVVLIGVNTPYIKKGLSENGFDEKKILFAKSPSEAVCLLQSRFRSGDTILFMNDLPDNY